MTSSIRQGAGVVPGGWRIAFPEGAVREHGNLAAPMGRKVVLVMDPGARGTDFRIDVGGGSFIDAAKGIHKRRKGSPRTGWRFKPEHTG